MPSCRRAGSHRKTRRRSTAAFGSASCIAPACARASACCHARAWASTPCARSSDAISITAIASRCSRCPAATRFAWPRQRRRRRPAGRERDAGLGRVPAVAHKPAPRSTIRCIRRSAPTLRSTSPRRATRRSPRCTTSPRRACGAPSARCCRRPAIPRFAWRSIGSPTRRSRPRARRTARAVLPPAGDPAFRLAVHRLADQALQAALGTPGIAATRILFVKDGKVYQIDQDGADQKLVSSTDRQAMSPAWSSDGRHFAYMEFQAGKGWLYLQEMNGGKRTAVSTTGTALDFTPAFSPDGQTLAFSRATEDGTDIYTINVKNNCCLRRLTVGRFSDNLSPTFSPDGQRIAFVSTRPGLPQIYVMAADGTDQQLFAPFDYGVTGASNAPEWSPDGQSVAFHRDVAGTLQVFVLDVRTRTVRQLTSVGRNEDPPWAPDSRHMAFWADRSGYRQLWIIDLETGRIRPLLQQSGARLPAWSPRLPETDRKSVV